MIGYIIFGKGYLGIQATAKKLKLCKGKKSQHNESMLIKRATTHQDRQGLMGNNNNNANNTSTVNNNNGINNTTMNNSTSNQENQIR